MESRQSPLQLLIALIWILCGISVAEAQVWESGFALLGNDRCLDGRIELVADRYVITKEEGNQVSIPRNQVQFIGKSRRELYQFKLRSLPSHSRAGDHFKLAQWCLTMQLLPEAGQHYLSLIESHPPETSPPVKRLGKEIKDAMLQQPEFRAHLGLSPLIRPTAAVARSAMPSSVVAASAEAQFASGQHSAQVKALFAEHVQQILINRCGQANCHGHAASNPFRLELVAGSDAARKSQDNLEAVLRYISRNASSESSLLEYAVNPHGQRSSPPIAARESHLVQEIDRWIHFVQNQVVTADGRSSPIPSGLRPVLPGATEYRQVPRQPNSGNQQGKSSTSVFPENFPVGAEIPTAEEIDSLDELITQQTGFPSVEKNAGNQDPFDPNEFNRMRASTTANRTLLD